MNFNIKKEHVPFQYSYCQHEFCRLFYQHTYQVFIGKRYKFRNQSFRAPMGSLLHTVYEEHAILTDPNIAL